MLLPTLLIVFIAATPLGYAVYRAWKLAELERMARLWDGQRLGRLAESIDLDRPLLPDPKPELDLERLQLSAKAVAGMEALGKAMRASKVTIEELSEPYQPQPEYEEMQFAQADWTPGE